MKKKVVFALTCICLLMSVLLLGGCEQAKEEVTPEPQSTQVEENTIESVEESSQEDTVEVPEEESSSEVTDTEETKEPEQEEKKPSGADKYWDIINNNSNKGNESSSKVDEPYYREEAEAFVTALNKEREALGRAPLMLKTEGVLYKMAIRRAKEISTDFRHDGSGGVECIQRTNVINATAEESVASFKTSKDHWAILTSANYKYISVAFYVYTDGFLYVSANMGGLIE